MLYFFRAAWTAGIQKLKDQKDGKPTFTIIKCADNGKKVPVHDEAFVRANNPEYSQYFYGTPAEVKGKKKEGQDRIKEQNDPKRKGEFKKPFKG
jgi:hypothetical protein